MPRKAPPPVRRIRRTAEEARAAILDAAEQRLAASGPAAIRLQEVARDVGVSHPTVLHHFGSREALVDAVVQRALDSLHTSLLSVIATAPDDADGVTKLLDAVWETLVVQGHGRTFLWLLLSGYAPAEDLRVHSLAEAVHAQRLALSEGEPVPPFEDSYFTVLLPALALLALSGGADRIVHQHGGETLGPKPFRRWLARLIHDHLAMVSGNSVPPDTPLDA